MEKKKKILWNSEASFLNTGFSVIGKEVLTRLYNTGKYDVVELGCIPDPHAEIEMSDGSHCPISTISVGDEVVTHLGNNQKVTETFVKDYSGDIISISRANFASKSLQVTPNHPILTIPKSLAYKYDRGSFNKSLTIKDIQWERADSISAGDFVAYTIPKKRNETINKIHSSNLSVSVSDDLMFLLGWFLGDGCVIKNKQFGINGVSWCGNLEKEIKIGYKIKNLLEEIFKVKANIYLREAENVFEVKVTNREVACFFAENFGLSCYDKFLSPQVTKLSENHFIKLLAAYAESDGSYQKNRNTYIVKTSSYKLGRDFVKNCLQRGIDISRFAKQKRYKGYILSFSGCHAQRFINEFKNKKIKVLDNPVNSNYFKIENIYFYRVTQIHKNKFEGPVYNFEVLGDDSYICNGFSVHNSYAKTSDPRALELPWKFYGGIPEDNDKFHNQRFNSTIYGQFGQAMFESVCLEERPDILISIRDQWMAAEWELQSPFIKNTKYCFDGKTNVYTESSFKQIKDINIGDYVLTHRGKAECVNNIYKHKTEKDIVNIRSKNWYKDIICTDDHKFLVIKNKGRVWSKDNNLYRPNKEAYNIDSATWVEAKQIDKGDMLVYPRESVDIKSNKIKLEDHVNYEVEHKTIHKEDYIRPYVKNKNSKFIKNKIIIDEDLARIFGYFIAEGHTAKNYITFSFNKNERKYIDDVISVMNNKFKISGKEYIKEGNPNCSVIQFNSKILSSLFKQFYNKDGFKVIPDWLFNIDNKLTYQVVIGMVRGDGCSYPGPHGHIMCSYFTNSEELCGQLFRLLCRHKIISNIKKTKKYKKWSDSLGYTINSKGGYNFDITGLEVKSLIDNVYPNKHIDARFTKINKHQCWFDDFGNLITKVRYVKHNTKHNKVVYDISVENDHSFLTPFVAHNCYMPTVDGFPQKFEWMGDYEKADVLLTYTQFAKDLIEEQSCGEISVREVVRPGVNHDIYTPMDKQALRKAFNLPQDALIVGTVMRNQKRKLYPDLLEAFAKYLEKCKAEGNMDLYNRSFLYLHTSYPDVGYDIPAHVLKNKLSSKVLVTYNCATCEHFWPSFLQGELTFCPKCGNKSGHMPNTQRGLTRENLAVVYNLFDLYVQYAISEGLSCPIVEAKACEIPVLAVDHSAMTEHTEIEGCDTIAVQRHFHETVIETEQVRALPDPDDLVEKMYKFFSATKEQREHWGRIARIDAVENYSFDRAAKIYEDVIDSLEIYDQNETWLNPKPNFLSVPMNIPNIPDNAEFVDWCIDNILKKPELKNSYWRNYTVKCLNTGTEIDRSKIKEVTRQKFLESLNNKVQENNFWESQRIARLIPKNEDKLSFEVL